MAVIKLSTNITDIRGKSGGSVFAKNKGGNYFRANPKPVQQNTLRHQARKIIFADISQKWRSLTPEQQQSWNDAAVNFPQINKVGDQMFLSGANLFQQMNTSLKTIRKPLISVPPAVPTLPDFPNAETIYPDWYQYMPNASLSVKQTVDMSVIPELFSEIPPGILANNNGFTFVANVMLESRILNAMPLATSFTVFYFMFANNVKISYSITRDSLDSFSWQCRLFIGVDEAGLLSGGFDPSNINIWTPIYISFETGTDGGFYCGYSRNNDYEFNNTYTGTIPAGDMLEFGIIFETDDTIVFRKINNIRMYDRVMYAAEMLDARYSYIFGDEILVFDFVNNSNTASFSSVPSSNGVFLTTNPASDILQFLTRENVMFAPRFDIVNWSSSLTNFVMNIYSSGPISAGRIGKRSGVRRINSYRPDINTFRKLSLDYEKVYTYTPVGSIVDFFIEVVDIDSGIKKGAPAKTKKKVIKFKAGSDLSDTVN